jgi:phage recombination protein Bet
MNAITTTDDKPTHDEVIRVLENSLYPGAKRESIELVLAYCRANGLDPMLRPVYIVPTSVKKPDGTWETRDVLMPGIADYRIKAARSGEYGGKSEPEFGPDVRETLSGVAVAYPAWCRITVRRIVQGQAREFVATERWLENYATAKRDSQAPNAMWKKRPYGQLAKVAEAQALRMAFPEFSAGYTMEEMQGKTGQDDWSGPTIDAEPPPDRRLSQMALAEVDAARQTLNDSIPLKSAAAKMARPERKVDPTPYEAGLVPETDEQRWKRNLLAKLAMAKSRADVVAVGALKSVHAAQASGIPELAVWVTKALNDAFAKFPEEEPEAAEPGDDLDEVVIEGQEKLAAG